MRSMYGITRGSGGWKVELKRNGTTLFKRFIFKMHQGEAPALARAQAWRDQMVRQHPPVPRRQRADILRRNNTTGIPGVSCRTDAEGEPRYWIVQTYIGPGTMLRKCFSVGRYGPEARQRAIAEREEHLRLMAGLARVHPHELLLRAAPPRPLPANCPAPVAAQELVRSTNRSGIPGVFHRRAGAADPGRWVAATRSKEGLSLQQSFSVGKYGEAQAKALAVAARQAQLRRCAADPGPGLLDAVEPPAKLHASPVIPDAPPPRKPLPPVPRPSLLRA
ncbi:AP2 domain-containing protein [Variovorax sp. J22P271]|uniref:AP2 domain-containing protein n=1 Tax=Variovorax davisae TaxID=3053515 RepID=UPI002576B42F|nr:AP2 domain-containing protein [Variovorax sp. J22P271]MDM0034541.1 AP2 domain-containing protein [Variovorax sp. J22P271]